jgi:hypothetical protein
MSDRETLLTLAKAAKAFVEWLERWPDSEKTCSPRCNSVTPAVAGDETVMGVDDGAEELRTEAWGVMRVGGSWVSLHGTESAAYVSKARCDVAENWLHVVVPLVSRTDAERLIAAARREAEEARAECERLRLTDDEREAMEAGAHALNQASATARPDDRYSARGVPGSFRLLKQAAAIRWFLARHARETVGG